MEEASNTHQAHRISRVAEMGMDRPENCSLSLSLLEQELRRDKQWCDEYSVDWTVCLWIDSIDGKRACSHCMQDEDTQAMEAEERRRSKSKDSFAPLTPSHVLILHSRKHIQKILCEEAMYDYVYTSYCLYFHIES